MKFPPQYTEYMESFRELGVRQFEDTKQIRKQMGDYVSILVLRDILFSMLTLNPATYTPYLYSWGKFVGRYSAEQSFKTLHIGLFTKAMGSINCMKLLKMDIYKDILTKSWIDVKSIPSITYIDEHAKVFRIETKECDEVWGLPKLSKCVCFFESGILAGSTEAFLNRTVNGIETKCPVHGDSCCEFLYKVDSEFPDLEIYDKALYKKIKSAVMREFVMKDPIRKKLGDYNHISSLQITYLGLWLSSPGTHTMLYWIGRDTGMEIGKKHKKGALGSKLNAIKNISSKLRLGIAQISKMNKNLTLTLKESAFAAGAKNLGKPICSYYAGFVAGFLTETTGKKYNVVETKCIARGDKSCEFIISCQPSWS